MLLLRLQPALVPTQRSVTKPVFVAVCWDCSISWTRLNGIQSLFPGSFIHSRTLGCFSRALFITVSASNSELMNLEMKSDDFLVLKSLLFQLRLKPWWWIKNRKQSLKLWLTKGAASSELFFPHTVNKHVPWIHWTPWNCPEILQNFGKPVYLCGKSTIVLGFINKLVQCRVDKKTQNIKSHASTANTNFGNEKKTNVCTYFTHITFY